MSPSPRAIGADLYHDAVSRAILFKPVSLCSFYHPLTCSSSTVLEERGWKRKEKAADDSHYKSVLA